ncbi:MAG: DUF4258 domain-containing protein [Deltaproteobacteria bacterium]|nr:MAG: DUF4258 domain-containing protein [Deltaproteobacteria bacterium]
MTEAKIESIREAIRQGEYRFTIHALERCIERNISPKEIEKAILNGEIIEYYSQDKYGPSCLICGMIKKNKILHVLCSVKPVWIITSYDPTLNPSEWNRNYKIRRKRK